MAEKLVSNFLVPPTYLYNYIRVSCTNNEVYEGWLKCIGPPYGNLVVCNVASSDDKFELTRLALIPIISIKEVKIVEDVEDIPLTQAFIRLLYTPEEPVVDVDRRDRLVAYIRHSLRVPVKIDEDGRNLTVFQCIVEPNYQAQHIFGFSNTLVLVVSKIIEKFDNANVNGNKSDEVYSKRPEYENESCQDLFFPGKPIAREISLTELEMDNLRNELAQINISGKSNFDEMPSSSQG